MPENWSLPTITSNYATGVIQAINNKFIDCITLFRAGDGSNLPVNAIRYNGDLNGTFQRWNGTLWNNMILAVAGGGTGSDNPAGIRTNLGLGTMSVQNSNAVDITGGNAVGMGNITANNINGATLISANGSGINQLDGGKITTGIVAPARLGSGLANNSTFLRGDSTWAAPAGTLPSGLIAMFATACPAGWTRVLAFDGKFLRGSTTYGGVGGAATHSHTGGGFAVASHSHPAGGLVAANHNHGGVTAGFTATGGTSNDGNHSHGYGGTAFGTTGDNNAGNMNVDAGNSGVMSRGSHQHDFGVNFSGETNQNGGHSHSVTVNGSAGIPYSGDLGVGGNTGAASPGISGATDAASSLPPYVDVVFCQKD